MVDARRNRHPPELRPRPLRDFGRSVPYPCISTDVRGIERSLRTVWEDLQHDGGGSSLPRLQHSEPRRLDTARLAECFACDLCARRMRNPYTSLQCLHSFCHRCIERALMEKNDAPEKRCPVPGCGHLTRDGFQPTILGRSPLSGRRQCIVNDVALSTLIEKLFEADEDDVAEIRDDRQTSLVPNVRAVVAERTLDDGPVRLVRTTTAPLTERIFREGYIVVGLLPLNAGHCFFTVVNFYVPMRMTVHQFCHFLEERFRLRRLELFCEDVPLCSVPYLGMTLQEASDEFWAPWHETPEDVFTMHYRQGGFPVFEGTPHPLRSCTSEND